MVFMPNTITLTKSERMELTKQAATRSGRAEDARRARLVLLLAEGHTWDDICERLPCSRGFIDSWSKRFAAERVAGLYSRHRGQAASVLTPRLEARILEWTLKRKPTDGSTQWSTRKLGQALGYLAHDGVAGVGQARIAAASPGTLPEPRTIRSSRRRRRT